MILTEYNQERHEKTLLEEGRQQGRAEAAQLLQKEREQHLQSVRRLLLQILKLKGLETESVTRRILAEEDLERLQLWTSFAADIDSAEELEKKILDENSF